MSRSGLLGELEQRVMLIIWDAEGALSPRQVLNELDDGHAYTTIMTILSTLHSKGMVTRVKVGKTYYYSKEESKKDFVENRLSQHFSSIIEDFGDLAVNQFVDTLKDDPTAIAKLQGYLETLKDEDK